MESSVHGELDREGHVLPYTGPRCGDIKILEVLVQPLVECTPYALSLMLRVDPDIEPEFLRMIHPGHMLTLSKPDRFWDIFANAGVSFEVELRLVETFVL